MQFVCFSSASIGLRKSCWTVQEIITVDKVHLDSRCQTEPISWLVMKAALFFLTSGSLRRLILWTILPSNTVPLEDVRTENQGLRMGQSALFKVWEQRIRDLGWGNLFLRLSCTEWVIIVLTEFWEEDGAKWIPFSWSAGSFLHPSELHPPSKYCVVIGVSFGMVMNVHLYALWSVLHMLFIAKDYHWVGPNHIAFKM